ncbi:hypothetical protein A1A1_11987 [Planococcus antarcticus DSM 14505]|uniref:DUF5590 domain-containing protein n=1 Tax=Planococcus antarcticus DSM 14505 TaxID=1185653 RepID=A0A1C7DDM4_9BACL|nr:hypothetical protein [Planococcus antarcticus]ANU09502.1 hypothetical protein BBH88_03865 [Planococcus antarcticus DSM 14505]EIM06282.1 hypothetical protein A1A1_11987 [Planococcus antarcticus DSM 14505]
MKKRLFIFFSSLIALLIMGYFIILFMFYYEPTPSKHNVEEMVSAKDLTDFGEVEGSYLRTPKNYGFYNKDSIYIVEQYLEKGEEYDKQYVIIEEGLELTDDDSQAINQILAKDELQTDYLSNLKVISKHRMTVYKNNEKVEESWLFKITYKYDEDYFLTFLLPENIEEGKFNFFAEGYEQFLQF